MTTKNTLRRIAWSSFAILSVCRPTLAEDAIDRYVHQEMQAQHIPGMSLAVVKQGKVVKASGYGVENLEQGTPATAQTVYRLASITKQFTATAIMLLVKDGRIALDDKINRHLDPPSPVWADITIRQLLTHTSGMKDYINELHVTTCNGTNEEELVKGLSEVPLNFKPGTEQAYSNTNYLVLGLIVKRVSGQSYDQFLKQRVFAPLAMTQTAKADDSKVVPHRTGRYIFANGSFTNGPNLQATLYDNGDAGLASSVDDLARWDAALTSYKVLNKASEDEMFTSAQLPDGRSVHYGFGWVTGGSPEARWVSHSGTFPGVSNYMVRYLDQRLTVIVLLNRSEAPASQIARHIAGIYDSRIHQTAASTPNALEEPAVTAQIRAVLEGIQDGSLKSEPFASEMWVKGDKDQTVTYLHNLFTSDGPLGGLSFLSVEHRGDERLYVYSAQFGDTELLIDFTLNKEGKIAAMGLQAE